MPIIIKTVGVSVYGGYTLLISIAGLVFSVSSFGVGFKCLRFLPSASSKESRRELFFPQMAFQFSSLAVLSVLLVLLSPIIKNMFFKDDVSFSMYLVVSYLMPYLLFYQSNNFFRNTHRVTYSIIQSVLLPYLNILLILIIYFYGHTLDVNILLATQAVSCVLVTIPLVYMTVKEIGFKFYFGKLHDVLDDIKRGFPLVVSYIVDIALNTGDRYLIALFLSVKDVGYYNPGYTLGTLVILFPKSFGMVLPQVLAKLVDQGDLGAAQAVVNSSLKIYFLLAIPFIVGGGVLSKPLLTMLANEEVAHQAYLVTPVVALGTLFYGLNIILTNVLFVRMKTKDMLNLNIVGSLVNVILNVLLFCFFRNIMVAAVTTFISYAVMFFLMRRRVLSDWPLDFSKMTLVKATIAACSMGICLFLMSTHSGLSIHPVAYILFEICAGMVIYVAALCALRTISRSELSHFIGVIRKRGNGEATNV